MTPPTKWRPALAGPQTDPPIHVNRVPPWPIRSENRIPQAGKPRLRLNVDARGVGTPSPRRLAGLRHGFRPRYAACSITVFCANGPRRHTGLYVVSGFSHLNEFAVTVW